MISDFYNEIVSSKKNLLDDFIHACVSVSLIRGGEKYNSSSLLNVDYFDRYNYPSNHIFSGNG